VRRLNGSVSQLLNFGLRVTMTQMQIKPKLAYYIKLGRGGDWERECLEESHILRLGYNEISHELCRQGKWDEVQKIVEGMRNDKGAATRDTNQIRAFYEADETVLWVTFWGDRLYWCFSEPEITLLSDNTKTRPSVRQWSSTDIQGIPLQKTQLSGSLLRMQGFRGTICKVKELKYLVRKINGVVQPEVEETLRAKAEFEGKIEALIRKLTWKDFEMLTDLIFRQAGWQRMGVLGKTEKAIDLDLFYPITEERFLVQVKSSANQGKLQDFRKSLMEFQDYDRAYFVVHTPSPDLIQTNFDDIELWLPKEIAHRVVLYGLADWVIAKVS
jgi:hypothetical protein